MKKTTLKNADLEETYTTEAIIPTVAVSTPRRLRSQHTYVLLDHHIEHPKGKSTTVPDEALSIADILQRSQNGLNPNVQMNGDYNLGDDSEDFDAHDIEKLKQLDPYDREMLARHLKAENEKHKQYLEEYEAKKRADDDIIAQEQEDARIAAFLEKADRKSKGATKKAEGGTTDN